LIYVQRKEVNMILEKALFKARLIEHPEIENKKTKEKEKIGKFTVDKEYKVYSIFSVMDFTDFLVADDEGRFHWISMTVFRSK